MQKLISKTAWGVGLLTIGLLAGVARADKPLTIVVKGAGSAGETAVNVPAPEALKPGVYALSSPGQPLVHVQVYQQDGKNWLAGVFPSLSEKGQSYSIEKTPEAPVGVEVKETSGGADISVGSVPFLTYQTAIGPKPFYWPIYGPTGVKMTRAYPMEKVDGEKTDHPHQRSLWFTHGKVNGIDFWSEIKGHGSIKETSRKLVTSGTGVAVIKTTDDWLAPDGKKVCEDERTVRIYHANKTRVMDFDIKIKATNGPVTFGETKEGMFGIRVPTSMDVNSKKGGKITNAEGLNDEPAWGKPSPWVDYTGPVEGQTLGVAILNHPESFRHPSTWHVRTYGLFAANPFGGKDFNKSNDHADHEIPSGQSIQFRYRVIFHEGLTAPARIADAYKVYAHAPTVELKAD